jgi:pyridoxine 5-phosphate synthase
MTKLSVNVNKLATLRNARGKNNPDVLKWSIEIESMGVHGITVHPRPDERHIRFSDVREIAGNVRGEFNIEGYPDDAWLSLVESIVPDQATLVPDPPDAITSNAGFNVRESSKLLENAVNRICDLKKMRASRLSTGTRISVFIDPYQFTQNDADLLSEMHVHRIELYTERFAETFDKLEGRDVTAVYRRAAEFAKNAGLGVNAGHDLTFENLPILIRAIPWIDEVSIGHALICDALQFGMSHTIRMYLDALKPVEHVR